MDHREALKVKDNPDAHPSVRQARRLAYLFDSAIRVPGTDWRVGWDSILGLIPGVGDVVTGSVSLWIILEARRLGAPRRLRARMLWNILLDTVVGTIPLVGDIFDAGFKANLKNVALLEAYLHKQDQRRDT